MTIPDPGKSENISLVYAYTQTLKPKWYNLTVTTQLERTLPFVKKNIVDKCSKKSDFVIELTETCNIHYHGLLYFSSEEDKLIFCDRARTLGNIHMKRLKDEQNIKRWKQYMLKAVTITRRVLLARDCKNDIQVYFEIEPFNVTNNSGLKRWLGTALSNDEIRLRNKSVYGGDPANILDESIRQDFVADSGERTFAGESQAERLPSLNPELNTIIIDLKQKTVDLKYYS